jgi:hypothetical protein
MSNEVAKNDEQRFTMPEDMDSAVISEILEIVGRQGKTVAGAQRLLQKAMQATELIAFEWNKERKIPAI